MSRDIQQSSGIGLKGKWEVRARLWGPPWAYSGVPGPVTSKVQRENKGKKDINWLIFLKHNEIPICKNSKVTY